MWQADVAPKDRGGDPPRLHGMRPCIEGGRGLQDRKDGGEWRKVHNHGRDAQDLADHSGTLSELRKQRGLLVDAADAGGGRAFDAILPLHEMWPHMEGIYIASRRDYREK